MGRVGPRLWDDELVAEWYEGGLLLGKCRARVKVVSLVGLRGALILADLEQEMLA
jgi:hypothetical protein